MCEVPQFGRGLIVEAFSWLYLLAAILGGFLVYSGSKKKMA